ncbi:MAG TPA: hypothetical protein PKO33_16175, partial [Pyrinomonadaceae bacterium]|nr:hypothetical protein [Pyrinomonadaceae bacterium]
LAAFERARTEIIELRDKVAKLSAVTSDDMRADGIELAGDLVLEDALSALVNLGYQKSAAEKALKQATQEGVEISVQKLLRRSLQILAK